MFIKDKVLYNTMEARLIKSKETKNIKIFLVKNIINKEYNFSVITYSKLHNIETGRKVFDTERRALNFFNKQ